LSTPVIVPSRHFKEKMIQEMHLQPHQVVQLKRGIELESFSPELRLKDDLWNQWFATKDAQTRPCRFLYVGRISREKELDFLAQVWDQANLEHSQLLLVGHGPYALDLQKRFLGDERVAFAGTLTGVELATIYAQADYFLFPSGTDTFGNVVVEALASGTPCLVSDSGGPAEIMEQCAGGWVLPFRNLAIWSGRIVLAQSMFLENQQEYLSMREHSFKHSKQYAIETAAGGLWSFYEKYLAKRHK
jgi:glycosyltransferase involved in cell wall biosynthesis